MSYNVYTVEYLGKPNHIAIFVQTESDRKGRLFHVIGNILQGMRFETKPSNDPVESATFVRGSMAFIGTIKESDISRFEAACEAVEVPGSQLTLGGKQKDPSKPVRRCGEWVQDAKAKLIADGILTAC